LIKEVGQNEIALNSFYLPWSIELNQDVAVSSDGIVEIIITKDKDTFLNWEVASHQEWHK
jgi:hypothetical protein